ncbi:hypothetical protein NP493_574g00041 [Ridgeia piscesae]|uniref:Uncharacterized protein n=1 Tax=Ridgeia piscesae TaxID=27915 RepID=A0AAD9KUP4_RIDPI|nr:hypothetical protein NP493_574g00041 [Ridgeia piscesae]
MIARVSKRARENQIKRLACALGTNGRRRRTDVHTFVDDTTRHDTPM